MATREESHLTEPEVASRVPAPAPPNTQTHTHMCVCCTCTHWLFSAHMSHHEILMQYTSPVNLDHANGHIWYVLTMAAGWELSLTIIIGREQKSRAD